jgi:hypothetical protein
MVRGTFRWAATLLLVLAGCRSADVNPRVPHADTGYVDFYTDSNEELSWEVKWKQGQAGKWKTAFSQFEPPSGNILRLAAPAGTHQFQVWFINEVTTGPQDANIRVENGKITPVHVTLKPAGLANIDNTSYEYRPTARATRRVTRLTTQQQQVFQILLTPAAPQDYQTKQRTPYCSPEPK